MRVADGKLDALGQVACDELLLADFQHFGGGIDAHDRDVRVSARDHDRQIAGAGGQVEHARAGF